MSVLLKKPLLAAFFCLLFSVSAFANQHTIYCSPTVQTFTLCRGSNADCGTTSNDSQDAITIENAPAGSVVDISATFTSIKSLAAQNPRDGSAPASIHFQGQGPTTQAFDFHQYFDAVLETHSVSWTQPAGATQFDTHFQIDNGYGREPQFFSYSISCSAPRGSITVVKKAGGGNAAFHFTSSIPGANQFDLSTTNGSAQQTFSVAASDTPYTLDEPSASLPANWSFTDLSCIGGSASATVNGSLASIPVANGDNITCTFINTLTSSGTGSITVQKKIIGGSEGSLFNFSMTSQPDFNLAGTSVTPFGSKPFTSLQPGSYTITEHTPLPGSNWALTDITCSGASYSANFAAGTATIDLKSGENALCTYTNTYTPPDQKASIKIRKQAIDGNGTFGFSFTPLGGNPTNLELTTTGSTSGGIAISAPFLVDAGTYTIQETTLPTPWRLTALDCGSKPATVDLSSRTVSVIAAAGDDITCTFTNTDPIVPQPATVMIVKQTVGRDGTFGFTSTLSGGNSFSLKTQSFTASSTFANVSDGQYTITESPLDVGWSLSSINCSGPAVVTLPTRSVTITIANGTGIICTFVNSFNDSEIRDHTEETIRNFMNRRADLITSEEPDRNRFIRRLTGSLWGNGGFPVSFSGSSDPNSGRMNIATSLSQIAHAANASGRQSGGRQSVMDSEWNPDIDIWVEAHYSYFKENRLGYDRSGSFGIGYLGADYLLTPDLLIGALIQTDLMTDDWKSLRTSVSGFGWMAGPYATWRMSQNLFLDGRFAWGESSNKVSPYGTYQDKFMTERSLARINLTGNWSWDSFRITPSIGVTWYSELQKDYIDSLGVYIPKQKVSLGRMSFGPELAYRFVTSDGTIIEPMIAITGFWDFAKDKTMSIEGVTTGVQSIRAKVEGGLIIKNTDDLSMRVSLSYDGIGDHSLNVYGVQAWLSAPFATGSLSEARRRSFTYDWTGFYIGAAGGLSSPNFHDQFTFGGDYSLGAFGAADSGDMIPVGGLYGGYNTRLGPFVLGAEADVMFRNSSWTEPTTVFSVPGDPDDIFRVGNSIGTTASIRGKIGYAWDHSMLYGTAGFIAGDVKSRITTDGGMDQDLPNSTYTQSKIRPGWASSIGLEHAFGPNWWARAEFRYSSFSGSSFNIDDPALLPNAGPNVNNNTISLTEGLVGIGCHF